MRRAEPAGGQDHKAGTEGGVWEPDAAAVGEAPIPASVRLQLVPQREVGEEVGQPAEPSAGLHGTRLCGIELLGAVHAFPVQLARVRPRIVEKEVRLAMGRERERQQVYVQDERGLVSARVAELVVVVRGDAEEAVLL